MKNPRLWICIGTSLLIFACVIVFGPQALATEKPKIIPPPAPVVIVEKERDYTAGLVAAGIGLWLIHRRAKRARPEPLVLVPPEPPTCEPVVERVLEACGVSK